MKGGVENMNQKGAMVEGRTIHKHVKEKIIFLKYSISKATVKYAKNYLKQKKVLYFLSKYETFSNTKREGLGIVELSRFYKVGRVYLVHSLIIIK